MTVQTASRPPFFAALFLVAGTCIGGGMLALPIATGVGGFLPSCILMTLCWAAMTATALLLLEASFWMEEGAHVITMSARLLGPIGKWVSWLLYLFVAYASLIAYAAGAGAQIALSVGSSLNWGAALFLVLFGFVLYCGGEVIGRVNALLFGAMVAAYFGLAGMGVDELHPQLLLRSQWSSSIIAVPLLLTAFSFQTMVPSLTPYLKRNVGQLRMVVVGGSSLAFLIYLIWQLLILGIIPFEGAGGLAEALQRGDLPVTQYIGHHVDGLWLVLLAEAFAFFAIATSFLGIAFGLFDFLADGLHLQKKGCGKMLLMALILLPTYVVATQFERIFLLALDATGGFGDTLLNGMIPVLMVWFGRYRLKLGGVPLLPGGRLLLICLFAFFLAAFSLEVVSQAGLLDSFSDAYDILEIHNLEELLLPS